MGILDDFHIGSIPLPPSVAPIFGIGKAIKSSAKKSSSSGSRNLDWKALLGRPFGPTPAPVPPSLYAPILAANAIGKNARTGRSAPSIGGGGSTSSVNAYASRNPKIGDFSQSNPLANNRFSASASSSMPDLQYDPFVDPYAHLDPEAMAKREFDPQFLLLRDMEKQTQSRYGAASKDIGNAWDILAKEISGKAGGIAADTKKRGKDVETGYGNVKKSTDAEYEAAKAEILHNAQLTGTMETVGGILAKLAEGRSDLNAQTGAYKQNAADFASQMGLNALEENRQAAEGAKWGGINAKADFAARLQGALNDISNKRLETQAAMGATANKYGMDISQMREQARQAWDTLQTQRMGQAMDFASSQAEAEARAAEAAAKAGTQKDIDTTKLTPTEYLSYLAQIQYPNVGNSTRQNAIAAIQDTFTRGKGHWANAADFVADMTRRNQNATKAGGDIRQLSQMAQDYYTKIAGGANKPYGQRT